jgi:hypothetical protein
MSYLVIFVIMKHFRNITGIVIMIPFLFSVSGILMFQSHCECTGNQQTSFYLPPETCHDWHKSADEAENISCTQFSCCTANAGSSCEAESSCEDCGCDEPNYQFYKIDTYFPDAKYIGNAPVPVVQSINLYQPALRYEESVNKCNLNPEWDKSPPPLPSARAEYIYFIHQPKVPHIA